MKEEKKNYTINLVRIFACLLYVWNHTSDHILHGAFNMISWANIGVQISFFMSGYLYSNKRIEDKSIWLKNRILKILKPYWICLIIILSVICTLNRDGLSVLKVSAAFAGIQGFGSVFLIEGLGQYWFISYILLCYLITPFVLKKIDRKFQGRHCWIWLGVAMLIGQIITIPLALFFQFKAAYIFTYITGYCYGARYADGAKSEEKRWSDILFYLIAMIGFFARLLLARYPLTGIYEAVGDLLVQWFKLFQGAAIFIAFLNLIPNDRWINASKNIKYILKKLSDCSYEILLVHEFFMYDMFTRLLPDHRGMQVLLIWLCIAFATAMLKWLEWISARVYRRIRNE